MFIRSRDEIDSASAAADGNWEASHASVETSAIVEEFRSEGVAIAGDIQPFVGRLRHQSAGIRQKNGSFSDELAGSGRLRRAEGGSLYL